MSLPALRLVQSHPVAPTVSELQLTIKEFLITMQAEGKSDATLRHYTWHLDRLVTWLSPRSVNRPADISRLLLREWAASLYEPYMITWAQLGIHRKPCGLVDVDGFFDGLLTQFDRAVADGLLRAGHRGLVVAGPDPERLLHHMAAWQPPPLEFQLDWSAT